MAVGALFSSALIAQSASPDYAAIFANNEQATVFVTARGHLFNGKVEESTGTGFFVSADGGVVTNDHVVFTNRSNYKNVDVTVRVGRRSATPLAASIEWSDAGNDLALLRVANSPQVRRVAVGISSTTPIGSRVAVMGFPLQSDLSIVDGLISSKPTANRWQMSAPMNFGNSGGPVFNDTGEVIGVAVSGAISATLPGYGPVDVDGISYLIPIDVLRQIAGKSSKGPNALGLELNSIKPTARTKPLRLQRAYTVSQIKDDHPVVFAPHTRRYERVFEAEPGYRVLSARLESLSANFVSGETATITAAGQRVVVSFTLQSGPLVDRYRGWFHATLHTEQSMPIQ